MSLKKFYASVEGIFMFPSKCLPLCLYVCLPIANTEKTMIREIILKNMLKNDVSVK